MPATHSKRGIRHAIALTLVAATAALALGPAGAAGPQRNPQMAAQLYELGVQAVNEKRYGEAARAFEKAYTLDPMPILLFNAARAHDMDNNLKYAYARYDELKTLPGTTAEQRREAIQRTSELETNPLARPGPGERIEKLADKVAPPAYLSAGTSKAGTGGTGTTGTAATTTGAKKGAMDFIPSKLIVDTNGPDGERPYMLSAVHCYWNGTVNRFQSCSATHAWGGQANIDLSAGRSTATANTLILHFKQAYAKRPFCSLEFQDIVAHKRLEPRETGVYVHLHDITGRALPWKQVSSWVSMTCHGVR